MITYRVDIAVDRPAADVFPYLADVTRHPSWMGGSRATPISDGPMRVGYRYEHLTDEGQLEIEITAFEPDACSRPARSGPMDWAGTFVVTDNGTSQSTVISTGQVSLAASTWPSPSSAVRSVVASTGSSSG